ncbi:MAG: cysteine desulfurase [Planctomycetes bacterium]|nr:cysteine desulfurase [Planctomycetota bacterium]
MKQPVYLDYNATTPHHPEVIKAMKPYLEKHFGNPSSSYVYGIQTKNAVENSRLQVAALLGCSAPEITFTSGGTESNNYAIKGIAFSKRHKGNHIITSQIEHPAVIEVCRYLGKQGFKVTYLPVDEFGMVRVNDVADAITRETILITIMHSNNEVGTIQPIKEIAKLAGKRGIVMHTDAAQSMGKIPVNVNDLGVDLLSVAGHKLYAPKGVGAIYIKDGIQLDKVIHGAGQEKGKRPGTENVLEIVGLGKACEIAKRDLTKSTEHLKTMRDKLYDALKRYIDDIRLNGHHEKRLPNTLNISFRDVLAGDLINEIKDKLAVSAGAACHSDHFEISTVLKAMNIPIEWAKGTIRFSTGKMTKETEINKAAKTVAEAVTLLRKQG